MGKTLPACPSSSSRISCRATLPFKRPSDIHHQLSGSTVCIIVLSLHHSTTPPASVVAGLCFGLCLSLAACVCPLGKPQNSHKRTTINSSISEQIIIQDRPATFNYSRFQVSNSNPFAADLDETESPSRYTHPKHSHQHIGASPWTRNLRPDSTSASLQPTSSSILISNYNVVKMPSYKNEPIAIIGSGCRFPGDSSRPSKLWDLLSDPRDVLRKIDRFRADNWYNQDGHHHGASNVLDSYLLAEDTRVFDAQFFSISASEAEAIDPQQRLLMETVYEALEASGSSIESLSGSNTAAYVGVMCDDFSQIVYGDGENVPTYAATGSARSIISNRISYFFNWHGPSMTIDTACSSSLIAVHQAVQVLRSGECPVAIAAGTNLIFGPSEFPPAMLALCSLRLAKPYNSHVHCREQPEHVVSYRPFPHVGRRC